MKNCYEELRMLGAFSQQEGYAQSVIGKQVSMRSGARHGFLQGMHKRVNFKTIPRVERYFRHDPTISDETFKQSENGKIFSYGYSRRCMEGQIQTIQTKA